MNVPPVMQFDTLDYAKRLENVGVPSPQAEAHAKALGDALARAVASPGDLVTLENNLVSKITATETRLDTKITATEASLDTKITATEVRLDTKITAAEARLDTKIDTVKNELKLELGGKIETLKWMFGVLVALNVGILIRVLSIN